MVFEKHVNGTSYKFTNRLFVFKFWRTNKVRNEQGKKLLFQLNRFENGYCTIYLRVFNRYSFCLSNINLTEGKRYFLGNKENY